MKWRTQTRPNGVPGVRDTIRGWDFYGPTLALVLAVLGAAVTQVVRIGQLETKVTDFRGAYEDKVKESVAIHETFVRKDVLVEILKAQDKAIAGGLDEIHAELRNIKASQMVSLDRSAHNLRILEKLPGAQEKR